jgi:endonuclease III
MIGKYSEVIKNIDQFTYEELCKMDERAIVRIIKQLGLSNSRYKYVRSMMMFIEKYGETVSDYGNDELIELISEEVGGASFKVAQCCVLYMRGYYSGIMPVDSGMKDVLLPCIGFETYNNSIGHELLRHDLESLVGEMKLKKMMIKNGYSSLSIPCNEPMTWWAHLVLIYFKRLYCNKHLSNTCPLVGAHLCSKKCQK